MRTYSELTLEERVEIQQRIESGGSLRAIGRSLGRAPSTLHVGTLKPPFYEGDNCFNAAGLPCDHDLFSISRRQISINLCRSTYLKTRVS